MTCIGLEQRQSCMTSIKKKEKEKEKKAKRIEICYQIINLLEGTILPLTSFQAI